MMEDQITGPAAAIVLPAPLVREGFSLRSETQDDIPFLERLFVSTRAEEVQRIEQWTDEQKLAFLLDQFRLQRHHYYTQFPNCQFLVLEHAGAAVGRLYLDNLQDALDVVDISLLPEWRGRGTGTALLNAVLDAAGNSGRRVAIFVEKFNPALNLYRRLAFRDVADHGIYLEMHWKAGGSEDLS